TTLLKGAVERLGFSAHASTLSGTMDGWAKSALRTSLVKGLERKRRKLEREGAVELLRLTGAAEVEKAVAAIRAFRVGRFEGDPIQNDCVADFYTAAAVEGSQGAVITLGLYCGGIPAAYMLAPA